jgi:hypothetical protein
MYLIGPEGALRQSEVDRGPVARLPVTISFRLLRQSVRSGLYPCNNFNTDCGCALACANTAVLAC